MILDFCLGEAGGPSQAYTRHPGKRTVPPCLYIYIYIYIYVSVTGRVVAVPGQIWLKIGTIGPQACNSRPFLAIFEIFIFRGVLWFLGWLGWGFKVG